MKFPRYLHPVFLASKKYYSRADYRLEQAEDQALLRFLHVEETKTFGENLQVL
jgi:hypothetical protein